MTCRRLIALVVAVAALAAVFAAPAGAKITIESFETSSSETQAGGHPDLTTSFSLKDPGNPEAAKNVIFNTPQGVFGNPNALTRCTAADYALQECPVNSQAGIITLRANYEGDENFLLGTAPIFDMVPQDIETARFSLIVPSLGIPIAIPVAVRTGGDYGLRFSVAEITQQIPLKSAKLTIWGMPGLATHNLERFRKGSPGNPAGCPGQEDTSCGSNNVTTTINVKPLINLPTTCSGQPLVTELDVQSYQTPDQLSHAESRYPAVDGCEHETFNPVLTASLSSSQTDSASGLNLQFKVPQVLGFTPSPSQAKSVIVTLPEGLTINPDAADGQTMCTDAAAHFNSEEPGECPDQAKIGTITLGTPALDGPLVGSIYIGEPQPGNQYRLFMILNGFGINAKLIGSVVPDPVTGQLTARFEDLPQVPFDNFDIHLFASDRGLMATPTRCSVYSVRALFIPWDAKLASQTSDGTFSVSSGPKGAVCPPQVRSFNPRLVAGMSNPLGGAFSSFHLKLDRDDGDQFLHELSFRLPPGFTGNLTGIPYCPEAQIAAAAANSGIAEQAHPTCPLASQVGTSNVAAGPGEHPFHAVGRMFLAGPFQGAPLSIVAVTPALAGPFDYGVVVVRVALHVDPQTAQVTAESGVVPSIIGGVPIRMRSIQVNIDRDRFTINPTNCSPFTVDSKGIGDEAVVSSFSSYFHAVNCAGLGFKPSMTVRQVGKKANARGGNPALVFDLRTRPGDANIKTLSVTLPNAFEIDQAHLGNLCSEKELTTTQCAGRQQIGVASTTTPLLDQPLSGPVYAVSGGGGLPRLAFVLDGQVDLLPRAESRTIGTSGRLQTMVPVVPDAPIGHFHLLVFGGGKGYLTNTRSLCARTPVVRVGYEAQNGVSLSRNIKIKAACGKRKH